MVRFAPRYILAITLYCLVAGPAGAADEVLGKFGAWDAVATTQGKSKLCYVAGLPQKSEGRIDKRGEASVIVSHWPAQRRFNVVEINAGYEFKKDSDVTVKIGDRSFRLFTKGTSAWTESAAADEAVAGFMKAGSTMIVTGETARGARITDIYDLSGMTAAIAAIDKACGVK
ncbi:MAG TPA: invasion associated locus B family protein [Alphaproteobacteria bacterium]|jgi:hypothetical protein|nr:invasion associated locus B family protein [Alphaproteobacteria bacterium]